MGYDNYDKLAFGRFLSGYDGDKNNHGDCFNYGSVSGCDIDCPALRDGKCEVPEDALKTSSERGADNDEIIEIQQLYCK